MEKQRAKQFFISLFSLAMIGYILLQIALNVGDMVEIEHATYISVTKKTEMKAYIFRDESVMTTSATGVNSYQFEDGEKIRRDEKVVTTYAQASDAGIQERIKEINKKIYILEQSKVTSGSSTTDVTKIDSQITKLMLEIIKAVEKKDISKASLYREDLLILTNRRLALVNKDTDYDQQIRQLEEEKRGLEDSLTGAFVTHKTTKAGYFYSVVDGYESFFTKTVLEGLTIPEFDNLKTKLPDQNLIETSVGKLVLTPEWYIVCEVDKRTASEFVQGKKYTFAFPFSSGKTLGMRFVGEIRQTDLDRALVVFATNEIPLRFNYTRVQTVELIRQTYEGLKIPTSALRRVEDAEGVYVAKGNIVRYKNVKILFEENGYYICELPKDKNYPDRKDKSYISPTELSLYDAVITSGRNIYSGKILQ